MERAAGGVAGFLRGDRSAEAGLGVVTKICIFLLRRRHTRRSRAEVYVLVPLRHAEWDAFVELLFAEALGRCVHHADEFVVVAVLFVEQRCGMLGIEVERILDGVAVVGEVVHLLRNFGMENLEAIVQRRVVVGILLSSLSSFGGHLLGAGGVPGFGGAQ